VGELADPVLQLGDGLRLVPHLQLQPLVERDVAAGARLALPGRLQNLYATIRRRAPFAQVIVMGYPRLFGPQECNGAARISTGEQKRLNQTADLLHDVELWETAASGPAFHFVDPRPNFVGHAICSGSKEWLNGLSNPTGESFHPNRNGQYAYFQILLWDMVAGGW
jgi:hypothetical protein